MVVSFQLQQSINLLFLIVLAYVLHSLYIDIFLLLSLVIFTITIEHMFIYFKEKKVAYFSYSSVTTTLGISLMMISEYWWIYFLVILLALLQKHFLTIQNRHLFNPSNFALIIAMLLFYNDAHIVLGQLGDDAWLRGMIVIFGIFILVRANRFIIPFSFIAIYLLLQYFFIVSYDPTILMEDIYARFYSVSFFVFIFFMLTDPRTTPKGYISQVIFALFLAFTSTILDRYYGFRVQHLFMVLFFISPFVVLLTLLNENKLEMKYWSTFGVVTMLSLFTLIFIENNPPYYFEMDS